MNIDISNGLSAIYLWLIFSITLSLFNCKIVKLINNNIYMQYITLLFSTFFLFIVLEPENSKKHIGILFINSFIILILFILLIKSNKYFSLLILFLILINQSLKVHINYLSNNNILNKNKLITNYILLRHIINIIIYVLIILGFILIIFKEGSKFNFMKFLKNTKC